MDHSEITDDDQAHFIATDWGISPDLLHETIWELEEIQGNEGEVYGFFVRFDDGTNADILAQLGLSNGEMTREVSLNAFDKPEIDTKIEEISGAHVVDSRSTRER